MLFFNATEEFLERGFDATNMNGVAARADVSKRTVYGHFASKDALFDAVLMALWEQGAGAIHEPWDPNKPLREQLMSLARQELALIADERFIQLARIALAQSFRRPEVTREAMDKTKHADTGIGLWIRQAADAGALEVPDVAMAATQLTALIKAFAFWPQVLADHPTPTGQEATGILESAVDMFLGYYRREGP